MGVAIEFPIYQPSMRQIIDITNANPASVTTSFAHNYKDLMIVRLHVPTEWGMFQADNKFGQIVVTGSTTFTIAIDTTQFDSFVTPVTPLQYPQSIPFAENNATLYAATVNVLPSRVF